MNFSVVQVGAPAPAQFSDSNPMREIGDSLLDDDGDPAPAAADEDDLNSLLGIPAVSP